LRLPPGNAHSCPAPVHPDDRRRAVPRRPNPAGSDASAAAAGDPRSPRSRRALPVGNIAETTKPGHSAGLRAVGRLLGLARRLRCDVLVHVEEIAGIVGPLDLDEARVVLAVVVPNSLAVVVLHG